MPLIQKRGERNVLDDVTTEEKERDRTPPFFLCFTVVTERHMISLGDSAWDVRKTSHVPGKKNLIRSYRMLLQTSMALNAIKFPFMTEQY